MLLLLFYDQITKTIAHKQTQIRCNENKYKFMHDRQRKGNWQWTCFRLAFSSTHDHFHPLFFNVISLASQRCISYSRCKYLRKYLNFSYFYLLWLIANIYGAWLPHIICIYVFICLLLCFCFFIWRLLVFVELTFTHLTVNKYGVICTLAICEKSDTLVMIMCAARLWRLMSFSSANNCI